MLHLTGFGGMSFGKINPRQNLVGVFYDKVIFGECESKWFGHDYGVKQGCIPSPALFSVLMNDLSEDMFENSIPGVPFDPAAWEGIGQWEMGSKYLDWIGWFVGICWV